MDEMCVFCRGEKLDWTNADQLKRFLKWPDKKGKPKKPTFCCRKHQKQLSKAIANAREMALLPYEPGIKRAKRRDKKKKGHNAN